MKKPLLLILLMLYIIPCSFCQTTSPSVIATAGKHYESENREISWTLGEVVTATLENSDIVLTQGFHQTLLAVTALNEKDLYGVEINVYPNPAENFLSVEIKTEEYPDFQLLLFDSNGRLLLQQKVTNELCTLDMQNYCPATYLLKVTGKNNSEKIFQIVKH